jgi:hypothetical protein
MPTETPAAFGKVRPESPNSHSKTIPLPSSPLAGIDFSSGGITALIRLPKSMLDIALAVASLTDEEKHFVSSFCTTLPPGIFACTFDGVAVEPTVVMVQVLLV